MKELSKERIEYAVGRLDGLMKSRKITQTHLEEMSGVSQSDISKFLARSKQPNEDQLNKLFLALGLKLSDILNESDREADKIVGYLATPLTFTVRNPKADAELQRVVSLVKEIAADKDFEPPHFNIYWPGEKTHPLKHAALPADQVYIMDRSRAATFDFVILFCAAPSYGVGQENEIVTQGGVPAIRLVSPQNCSRMMSGSFVRAIDVEYAGSLETTVAFDAAKLKEALHSVRHVYFRHHALYRGLNGDHFGEMLRKLVNDRCPSYEQFATDLGVSLSYVHNLMNEPFAVSNPSARLLKRMSRMLGVPVGYLLGESEESDAEWVESTATWRAWIDNTPGLDAKTALEVRDQWRDEYRQSRRSEPTAASFRKPRNVMRESDWDLRYRQREKGRQHGTATQATFL